MPVPTIEEVLRSVPIDWLVAALEAAFDPADPDWPSKVVIVDPDD